MPFPLWRPSEAGNRGFRSHGSGQTLPSGFSREGYRQASELVMQRHNLEKTHLHSQKVLKTSAFRYYAPASWVGYCNETAVESVRRRNPSLQK